MSKHKSKFRNRQWDSKEHVRPKKYLGQHFLKDENIAQKIGDTLTLAGYEDVLEIGPGMGVLTKYLIEKEVSVVAMDLDAESIVYLNANYTASNRSEEHTSELQSRPHLVCRLLLE